MRLQARAYTRAYARLYASEVGLTLFKGEANCTQAHNPGDAQNGPNRHGNDVFADELLRICRAKIARGATTADWYDAFKAINATYGRA